MLDTHNDIHIAKYLQQQKMSFINDLFISCSSQVLAKIPVAVPVFHRGGAVAHPKHKLPSPSAPRFSLHLWATGGFWSGWVS